MNKHLGTFWRGFDSQEIRKKGNVFQEIRKKETFVLSSYSINIRIYLTSSSTGNHRSVLCFVVVGILHLSRGVVLSSELRLLMSFSWPCFPGDIWTRFFSPHVFPGFWDSIPKRCKGVHCVDLGESFPTSIYLQHLASTQPRTSLVKFARSPCADPPGSFLIIL